MEFLPLSILIAQFAYSEEKNSSKENGVLVVTYGKDDNSDCISNWLYNGNPCRGEIDRDKENIFYSWSKRYADNVDWVPIINFKEFAEKRVDFVKWAKIQCREEVEVYHYGEDENSKCLKGWVDKIVYLGTFRTEVIEEWLKKKKIDVSYTIFVDAQEFKNERALLIKALKITCEELSHSTK